MNRVAYKAPSAKAYDVVIVGGAIMGASTAWFLVSNPDFDGSVLIVERDPTYSACSTAHTNSCIRQQFSNALNVEISQFAAAFIRNLPEHMPGEPDVTPVSIREFGYLYLAADAAQAKVLRANQTVQRRAGAATELLSANEIMDRYPFYRVDDIVLGSINRVNEGYWDGASVFETLRRASRRNGAEYVANEVVAMTGSADGHRIESVTLATGEVVSCGQVVNASGPRAARTAEMAGIALPVEPRKRFTWIFSAERPLDRDLPLTIDPTGVHVRENGGGTYMCGAHTKADPRVGYDDFEMDLDLWLDHVWPTIANRIPQFDAVRVQSEWAGHYAFNTLDQNAILGPHPDISNFLFLNGFSGHGLQQAPAMGRGTAEWLVHGAYQTIDLTPFHFERLQTNCLMVEKAII